MATTTTPLTPARTRRSFAPVLDARGRRAAGHPVRRFLTGVAVAYVVAAGLSILAGLLVTRLLITHNGIAHGDESFVTFLSHHRSRGLTEASLVGSILAGGVVLPIVVAIWGLVAAAFRQWRVAAFPVFALGVESGSYRTTTLLVHRHRPTVPRLENLPVNASYPSGHTAAAIAVYCGIALVAASRTTSKRLRAAIWAPAVLLPLYVAFARMYRGMHHPLDIAGGVLIGVVSLVALVLVARAADRATGTPSRA